MTLTLTNYEKAFLAQILRTERDKTADWLKDNENAFSAYFVKNETLPFLDGMLKKLED